MVKNLDPTKNFVVVEVSTGYDNDDTSIVLAAGEGAKLPAPATDGAFNLVYWNETDYAKPSLDPNKEIVRVTARSTDTLTVTRGQEGTSGANHNTGGKTYKMLLGYTKKTQDDIELGFYKRVICEIITFGTEGTEPTGGKHDSGTTPAAPTDGGSVSTNIPYIEMAASDQFVAKATLPANYVAGTPLFLRIVFSATVASGSCSATLDGTSVVLDVSGNVVSANMATHENNASVALTVSAANTNKILVDSAFEVTNSAGTFDDESDTDVVAAPGDVICTTVKRTDSDTEPLRIYSVEVVWS